MKNEMVILLFLKKIIEFSFFFVSLLPNRLFKYILWIYKTFIND